MRNTWGMKSSFLIRLFMIIIRFYQIYLSQYYLGKCIYEPSCSHYAMEAIQTFGVIKGMRLAIGRLLRCQSKYEGGLDPVPGSLG